MRSFYDAVSIGTIPPQASMVAGYSDGNYVTVPALRRKFPHARVVTITVNGSTHGVHVIDCETGDANPQGAAEWCAAEVKAGRQPTIYTYSANWGACKAAVKRAGLTGKVQWWIADWTGHPHLPKGAVACQWDSPDRPGAAVKCDVNVCVDHWPGVDPPEQAPVPLIGATRKAAETLAVNLSNRHAPVPAGHGDRGALAAAAAQITRVLAL